MFTGGARMPRSNKRAVVRRVSIQAESTTLVTRLLNRCPNAPKPPRIVGIDLTGSEKRATGWALMDGPFATTKAIRTDDELIREPLDAKPDLVSIDWPLSLPEDDRLPRVPTYRKSAARLH